MAIDGLSLPRRSLLLAALAGLALPAMAGSRTAIAASWEWPGNGWRVGLLRREGAVLRAARQVEVPTRAHGFADLGDGSLLAVARRPGDWLLSWTPGRDREEWTWAEADRCFTGHVVLDAPAGRVYTGETDLASGAGLIGVRDARSLEKLHEWPTHGRDPHQFLLDGAGSLVVANGGIETRPESGRRKLSLETMDSSLVRLDTAAGQLRGQWRVQDRRLSLRHLAWNGGLLGVAMQAEHERKEDRDAAPVLAIFDGRELRPAAASAGLAGYGGDIARHGNGFAVSAPRAGAVAFCDAHGRPLGRSPLAEACPLVDVAGELLAGGADGAVLAGADHLRSRDVGRLDNHWILVAGA
jgi:hypothetical protein